MSGWTAAHVLSQEFSTQATASRVVQVSSSGAFLPVAVGIAMPQFGMPLTLQDSSTLARLWAGSTLGWGYVYIQPSTNNIGDVGIASLPSTTVAGSTQLPAGVNVIGGVTLPSTTVAGSTQLPAGVNTIGGVTLPSTTVAGSTQLPAGINLVGKIEPTGSTGLAITATGGGTAPTAGMAMVIVDSSTTPRVVKGSTDGSVNVTLTGSIPSVWSVTGTSAANTAQTVTKAAEAGVVHYIHHIDVFVRAASVAADMVVELRDDATAKWIGVIGAGALPGERLVLQLANPIAITANKNANLVVPAGGASVITEATMVGWTK